MNTKKLFQIPVLLILLVSSIGTSRLARADASPAAQLQEAGPSASLTVLPARLSLHETASASVSLNGTPTEGYTSAEFTCTYPASLVQVSDIVVTGLFGPDPAIAIYDQQDGTFIVGIAGSGGNKAVASSAAFTFKVKGLQAGQTTLNCTARVSKGDNVLTTIPFTGAELTVAGPTATPTLQPLDCDKAEFVADVNVPPGTIATPGMQFTKTWRLKNIGSCTWTTSYRLAFQSGEPMGAPSSMRLTREVAPGETVDLSLFLTAPSVPGSYHGYWLFQNDKGAPFGIGPLGNQAWLVRITVPEATITPTSMQTTAPTVTQAPAFTPTVPTPTPSPSFTPTATLTASPTPLPFGMVFGRVLAGKPVILDLFDADNSPVAVAQANPDGSFSLSAPAGTYNLVARANGFLSAMGPVTIPAGGSVTQPTISLLPGDIDGNFMIDQFDVLTIGMNYNTAAPVEADLNNDGIINVLDLELLARNYRRTGPVPWQG